MRLYEIVVLVLAFCLVFTKAESQAGTETLRGKETFARDTNLDSTATKDRSSYLKEDPEKAAVEEDPKIPTKQDAKEDIRKRLFHRPRQLFLTVSVPTNHNVRFFQVSYCFRRSCYVPGLRQGFLSWRVVYQSGYVVIDNWLYFFWNCSPRPVPIPRPRPTRVRPSPTPTRTPFSRFFG